MIESEIRRKRAEATLSGNGSQEDTAVIDPNDDPDPDDSSSLTEEPAAEKTIYAPASKKRPSYVLVPVGAPKEASTYPTIAEDQPGPLDVKQPEPKPLPGIQTDEDTGTRYVTDADTGQKVPYAELATEADKQAFKPSDVTLPQVDVTATRPVRRAELVDPDPDLLYTTPQAGQPAPDKLSQVERGQLVGAPAPDKLTQVERGELVSVPPGTAPRAIGRAAAIPEPPKVQRGELVSQPPVTPSPEAPVRKGPASAFGMTPDEYAASLTEQPDTTATTTAATATAAGPPPMKAPNGGAPAALIIHHTSGRGSAANVVEGWRTERPGVGSQYVMDRDGTIHETQKEFGYGGTGHFLHSVIPGVSNQTAVGLEVIAKDDADMTPAQIESLKRFAGPKGPYANVPVYGHSQVSPGDRDNEGVRGVAAINEARAAGGKAPATTGAAATIGGGNYITGRATTFGHFDPDDPGVGAPRLGRINTNDENLIGIAVPQEALERFVSQHPADWRKARVEIVTSDGRHLLVPIVDLGPRDTSAQRGVVADFTYGLNKMLGNTGEQNYQFRIIANAGPDVMKNPQGFADEQAAIAKGIYTGPQQKAAAKTSYVLAPVDQGTPAEQVARQTANQFQAQSQIDTLDELNRQTENPGQFWKLLNQPMPGTIDAASGQKVGAVSDAMRKAYADNFKAGFTKYAQNFYGEKDPDKAFQRAVGDANIGTFVQDVGRSALGTLGQFDVGINKAAKDIDFNRLDQFARVIHPESDGPGRAAFIKGITSIQNPTFRAQEIGKIIARLEPAKQAALDSNAIADSADRVASPEYQAAQNKVIADKDAWIAKQFEADPTLKGTSGQWWSGQIGSFLTNAAVATLSAPVRSSAFIAQLYGTARDRIKAEHPDWSDDQVGTEAAKSSFLQQVPQEALMMALQGKMGPLAAWVSKVNNPVVRFGLGGGIHLATGAAGGALMQAGGNIAEGKQPFEGVPEAALSGALQAAPFAIHGGVHALTAPRETIGPRGAPIRGAEEKTLTETAVPVTPLPASSGLKMEVRDRYGNVIGETEARKGRSSARTTVGEMLDAGGDSAVLAQEALNNGWSRDDPMPKRGETPPKARPVTSPEAVVQPSPVAASLGETPQTGTGLQNVGQMGGAIAKNMRDMLWNKFQAGDTTEAGGPSNLLLLAAREKAAGRVVSRADFEDFITRYGESLKNKQSINDFAASEAARTAPLSPVTQEDVARRAYELSEERAKSGQPGTPLDDWVKAQQELARATEPVLPATVSEAEPINSAIANRYVQERMATGELGQIDPAQGKSTEDMVQQGLQMSPKQRDTLIDNFTKGKGGDLDQQGAAIRSKEALLSEHARAASRAANADPANPQLQAQAKAAADAVTSFHNGPIKKFKQVWSDAGRGLQREIPLDYTTFNGMKEAYLKGNNKEAPAGLEPGLKRMADAVSKTADTERVAMNNFGKEIENRTRGKPLPTDDKVRARLMEIMRDLPCRN